MENQYYYEEIMALYGLDEMKSIIKKWNHVSRHLEHASDLPIVLPNLLWMTKPGIGKSYFIRLLAEFLHASKLMSFYGTVKHLEFSLGYCPDDSDFSELRRLMRELEGATGYRGMFKGVLSIDLNQWIDHFDSLHFARLMAFLSGMDNALCILFVLENSSDATAQELESVLAQYVRIEKVQSNYPSVSEMIFYVENWLSRYNFSLNEKARELLMESVETLRENTHFDGFKTLNLMCEDIVFEACASEQFRHERILGSEDLFAYSKEGIFITRLREMMKKRQIGFVTEAGGAYE